MKKVLMKVREFGGPEFLAQGTIEWD